MQAAAGSDQSKQEALLRSRIAEYFGQQQESPAAPRSSASAAASAGAAAATAAETGASAECAVPGDGAGQDAEARAAGGSSLAGLPVRAGHSSLALDCRELLAWARSAGLVRCRPAVMSELGYRRTMDHCHALSQPLGSRVRQRGLVIHEMSNVVSQSSEKMALVGGCRWAA